MAFRFETDFMSAILRHYLNSCRAIAPAASEVRAHISACIFSGTGWNRSLSDVPICPAGFGPATRLERPTLQGILRQLWSESEDPEASESMEDEELSA